MLARAIARAPRSFDTSLPRCLVCHCTCGATFRPNTSTIIVRKAVAQRRQYVSRKKKAPTTLQAEKREDTRVLSPERARLQRGLDNLTASLPKLVISEAHMAGYITLPPQKCQEFLESFQTIASRTRTGDIVPLDSFRDLLGTVGIKQLGASDQREQDLLCLSYVLLQVDAESHRKLGKQLHYSLSALGSVDATLQILNHALIQSKNRPNVLRSAEIARARGHLQKVAREGTNLRAVVLEGKVALELGDEAYAIKCWQDALPLAVKHAEQRQALMTQPAPKRPPPALFQEDTDNLTTPWVELYLLHAYRCQQGHKEHREVREAFETGLRHDDPFMVYQAGVSFSEKWSSDWLYYMSKAAASGMVQAMHELAIFYSNSPWKYVKTEPPNHIKPTPFDSFPKPGTSASTSSFLRSLFGQRATTKVDREDHHRQGRDVIFQTAFWPSKAEDRIRLALEWLEVATTLTYVPAILNAAELYLTRELPLGLDVPTEAKKMDDSRYDFANFEEYDEARQCGAVDEHTNLKLEEDHDKPKSEAVLQTPRPNPFYNEGKAASLVREIFFAQTALLVRQDLLAKKHNLPKRSVQSRLARYMEQEWYGSNSKYLGAAMTKYLTQYTVREQYEEQMPDLLYRAMEICDEMKWEIRGEDGGLMYQPGNSALS